ncbi:MAG: NADH:ubiquinone reductase (Na(+)-transporting) subunit D [Fibrobacteres bacterium]|nr:NADH:ubiquinone reductase (Na(+)-transporting) subunit D [Fibrobacterota bacterium]
MAESTTAIFKRSLLNENPVLRQVLGICSALAVTNILTNTLFMCAGVLFTTAMSNLVLSIMRNIIPQRIRMITQVAVISAFVVIVDVVIKALSPDVHRFIGPYVGLIITNCIIMGRAEAFAASNTPLPSFLDGVASGLGYSLVLIVIAVIREPLGFGTILGIPLPLREIWWHQWTIMVMPTSAFFLLALLTWYIRNLLDKKKAGQK